jgi:hypothetical protein
LLRTNSPSLVTRHPPLATTFRHILGSTPWIRRDAVATFGAGKYPAVVSGVAEIKQAIDRLSFQERCELMAMLAPPVYDEWDQQMLSDSEPGGKLDRLKERAHEEYQAGKCT